MRISFKNPFRTILYCVTSLALVFTANAPAVHAQGQFSPLISNSLFLYASSVLDFDTQGFLDQHGGPLKDYSEKIEMQSWTAAESLDYYAMFHGVNPQMLLILLEARAGLISRAESQIPRRSADKSPNASTFHSYVDWLAETAAASYYARRYGEDDHTIHFQSGDIVSASQDLNAGTYGLQTALAKIMPVNRWTNWATGANPQFKRAFARWFGDPTAGPDAADISAAALPGNFILPFPVGQKWYYTSGPHNYNGGTIGGCTSGAGCPRPWSSIDLAQPEPTACPGGSYPANRWVVAALGGEVIKSKPGLVVIQHGNGWRTYYLHLATADRHALGAVKQGDRLGHPSCEGGITWGIHVHFAIYRENVGFENIAGSSLSGWVIHETGTHYNGTMTRASVTRTADASRINGTNDILNSGVGFNSQFTANANGWTALKGTWGVSTNGYFHTPGVAESFVSAMHNNINTTLTYTVRMRDNGCTNCGNYIYFRGTPNPVTSSGTWNNAYVFEYTNNGYFIIGKQAGGLWTSFMSDWEYSPFISSGWNTLKVTANGGFVQFFINGFRLKTMLLTDFSVGRVGIGFWHSALSPNHLYVDWATLSPSAPSTAASGDDVLDSIEYPEIMPDPRMSP